MADKIVVEYEARIGQLEAALKIVEGELVQVDKVGKQAMKNLDEGANKAAQDFNKLNKPIKDQVGLLEQLQNEEKILKASRDKSNDPKAIKLYNTQLAAVKKQQEGLTRQQVNLTRETTQFSSLLKNLVYILPFAGIITQVTQVGEGFKAVEGSAKKASSGFQVLKSAIIGTGIGALVIALVALISYFKRTDEGAARLSGIMSALGAAADLVTGAVVGIGEAIFDAGSSFTGFKDLLSDIGDFLIGQFVNRFQAVVQQLGNFKDLIVDFVENGTAADFEGALDKMVSTQLDFVTGVKDSSKKISEWTSEVAAAAQAAYEWELQMDALEDKIRKDSMAIAENDAAITRLIISSKNKQITDEQSLKNIDDASAKEKENFNLIEQNEKAKLALIQEKNKMNLASINQDKKNLTAELFNSETSANRRKAILKELRSINDKDAQEEVDQINKITSLRQASDNLLEKINNRRDAKLEEIFQNNIKRLSQEEILQENLAKEKFINGVTTAQELEDELYRIKLEGLQRQKELLVSDSRDIVDIDKAILDLQLQNRLKSDKEKADLQKTANDKALKEEKERLAKEAKYKEDFDKQQEAKQKEHEAKILMIKQAGVDFAQTLVQGLFENLSQKRQFELDDELKKSQEQTDSQIEQLDARLEAGTISEEEFNRRKDALDEKQAKKEAEVKKKQFQANKKAQLVDIAINTAASIVKTLATAGIPAGIPLAAVALALGLAQGAVVASQPTPKFRDGVIDLKGKGTTTSDSILAKLSRGESVMTAQETAENKGFFQAIRDGRRDEYFDKHIVSPALRKMDAENNRAAKSRRDKRDANIANMFSNSMDTANMERLLKKNSNVGLKNVPELAKAIAKELTFNNNFYR